MKAGQEIGMINIPTDWPLEEWKDIRIQNYVKQYVLRAIHPLISQDDGPRSVG